MLKTSAQASLTTPRRGRLTLVVMENDEIDDSWKLRLGDLIESRGISKAALARMADVTPSAVTQWLMPPGEGTRELSGMVLAKLCKGLNIRPEWLMLGDGSPDRRPEMTPEVEALVKALQAPAARPTPRAGPTN